MDSATFSAFANRSFDIMVKVARERAFLDELQKISQAAGFDTLEKLASYYGYDDVETFIKESGLFSRAGKWIQPRARRAYESATVGAGNLMTGHTAPHVLEGLEHSMAGGGSVGKFLAGGGGAAIAHGAQKAAPHIARGAKKVGKGAKRLARQAREAVTRIGTTGPPGVPAYVG